MKRFMHRQGLIVLLAMFCIFGLYNYAAAADAIDDMVTQMQDIYSFMSDYDKDNISAARIQLQDFALNGSETEWDDVLGVGTANNLLTPEVIAGFGNEAAARAAAKDIVTGLGNIYYSNDSTVLRNTLEGFKADYVDEFQILFGADITMDELYGLFSAARDALPGVFSETEAGLLATSSNQYLLDNMPDYLETAMDEALLLPENQIFSGRLADIGWSSAKLIAQQEVLAGIIDPDGDARLSIALAAIRSETTLEAGPTTLRVGDKPSYTINIMGRNASDLVAWASDDPSIVDVTTDPGTGNFVIEAKAPGTTRLIVYRDYTGADPDYDWLYEFDVTVKSSGGGGGGGGALPGMPIRTSGSVLEKYDAVFDVPAGAVAEDTKGDIVEYASSKIAPPAGSQIIGSIFELTKKTEGDFLKPVEVTLPFDRSLTDLTKFTVSIYWFNDDLDKWIELDEARVDALNVSGETTKTGYFALIATPKIVTPVQPVLTDISGHWAETAIRALVATGAIEGYPDKTFKPQQTITRAEFATVLVKAFKLDAAPGKVFDDTASHWAKDLIAAAYAAGIIEGYDAKRFGPDDLITREQMAVMIVKASKLQQASGQLSFKDSGSVSAWAYGWVMSAVNNQLMQGYSDNTFRPQNNATRAEAVTVIYNALN